jgi:hypothetical protein
MQEAGSRPSRIREGSWIAGCNPGYLDRLMHMPDYIPAMPPAGNIRQ